MNLMCIHTRGVMWDAHIAKDTKDVYMMSRQGLYPVFGTLSHKSFVLITSDPTYKVCREKVDYDNYVYSRDP